MERVGKLAWIAGNEDGTAGTRNEGPVRWGKG